MPDAYYWFGGFAVLSVVGGLIGLIPPLRRAIGRFRPTADPARRRGMVAGLFAVVATVVSSLLAAAGGLLTIWSGQAVDATDGVPLTALALGAALLGGTSAFGRRGGILGTPLAVALIAIASAYTQAIHHEWNGFALAAVAIGLGLAVTRAVERFGRPDTSSAEDDDEDWSPRVHSAGGTGAPTARSWQPASVPATPTVGGLWASDDAWGAQR
jgi:hypothetical protein